MSQTKHSKCGKRALFDALCGQISKTCIVKRGRDWVVKGKSCIISRHSDGTWDIWICDPNNPRGRLGKRSVTNRTSKLRKYAQEGSLTTVNGEAWLTVRSIDFLVQDPALCRLLGIRRKRQLSANQKNDLLGRLTTRRSARAA